VEVRVTKMWNQLATEVQTQKEKLIQEQTLKEAAWKEKERQFLLSSQYQLELLEKKTMSLEQEIQTMSERKVQVPEIVKLNVGGTKFTTTSNTLVALKGTFLEVMFSGRFTIETDEEGHVFIDRSGVMFGIVLEYLRNCTLPDSQQERENLLQEILYYQLPIPDELQEAAKAFTNM